MTSFSPGYLEIDNPVKSFDDVKNTLSTGDIILFNGRGPWSITIKKFCRSNWSHIGMVIRTRRFRKVCREELFLWHSTIDIAGETMFKVQEQFKQGNNIHKIRLLKPFLISKNGVQLNPLRDALLEYQGTFSVRYLNIDTESPYYGLIPKIKHKLFKWMKSIEDFDYEKDLYSLVEASYGNYVSNIPDDDRSFFCSELVLKTLKVLGLIHNISSSSLAPKHFSSEDDRINKIFDIQTNSQIQYEKEIEIFIDRQEPFRILEHFF